jgi:hypothetical protein
MSGRCHSSPALAVHNHNVNPRLRGYCPKSDRKRENIEDAGVLMPGPGGVLA